MLFRLQFWEAVGVIGGMIIGSGMFALPYAVNISGIIWGVISAVLALFAVLGIHLAYGEVILGTEERHRLPGYAKLYLGAAVGRISASLQVIGFNMALLIYAELAGIFLNILFGGGIFFWTVVFFAAVALILYFQNIERIGFINFILTIPLVLITMLISFLAFQKGSVDNLPVYGSDKFFSFGIFVFALAGLSVIADAREIFKSESVKKLKAAIIFGTTLPFFLYLLFIFGVLSAADGGASKDAISGLAGVLGTGAVKLGAIVGILAVFTSFIALGFDLKQIYELDLKTPKFFSWAAVMLIPLGIYLLGADDIVKLISIVGGIFIAVDGIIVLLILRKLRGAGGGIRLLPDSPIPQLFIGTVLFLGIVYELIYQVF